MTLIKKFAWYGSSVAFATVLALALLVTGPARTAEAGAISVVGFQAPVQAAGLTETWTVSFTTAVTVPATTGTITIDFPTSFTTTGVTASDVTLSWGGTPTVNVATNGRIIITNGANASGVAAVNVTIANVKNPTATTALTGAAAPTATAGFSVTTSVDTVDFDATPPQVWNTTATKNPTTSVQADGSSTVAVTFTPSATALNAGTGVVVLTGTTDSGTIAITPTGALAAAWTAVTTPVTSVTGTLKAGLAAADTAVITVKAPTTPGTSTVILRATPATGGQAVIIGATTITWTTASAAPGAVVSASVAPATAVSTTLTGTTAAITATFVDANGNAPIPGGAVTVNTTMGVLANSAGAGTCANQACTGGSLASNGQVAVTLTGGGVAGTATITFTVGGVSTTKTVVIAGTTDTLTAAVQADADGAGTGTAYVAAATPGATTFTNGVRVSVDPKDAAGNRVPSVSPVITVAPSTCATVGATTASTSTAAATTVLTAGSATVGTACTLTATVGTKTATTTFTIGSALASTSTVEVAAVDMAVVSTQSVNVTVKSSAGVLVQDGTSVTLVASAGAVATSTVLTINGVATFTYVSPGTAQNVNLTAVAGSVNASKAISVGGATPVTPSTGEGTFASAPAESGVSIVVFNGGTVAQLAETAAGLDVVSVSATVDGAFVVYIVGAPAFVNAAFNAAFPDGIAAGTAVILKK